MPFALLWIVLAFSPVWMTNAPEMRPSFLISASLDFPRSIPADEPAIVKDDRTHQYFCSSVRILSNSG
jgi:hypothetical protein